MTRPMRIGILLINLGTPEAPTAGAVRPYLKEFLSDRRVVEIPRAVWWPILNGVILNTRPRQSAEKYAAIWQTEGSPLKVHTERLSGYLAEELRKRCTEPIAIEYAMRYGQPNVAGAIGRLKAQGCDPPPCRAALPAVCRQQFWHSPGCGISRPAAYTQHAGHPHHPTFSR
jgi:ferrochelatase